MTERSKDFPNGRRILIPTHRPEDWRPLLGDPERHWKAGRSAWCLAHRWMEADGFPTEVRRALRTVPAFRDLVLLLAIPEHEVQMPARGRASQTDLWALARCDEGLVTIAVEGKVDESFGPTIGEWLVEASENKRRRLEGLHAILGLAEEVPGTIRYQLLHRTASAVLEARRFGARHAVMLVHSFGDGDAGLDDYQAFARLFGADAAVGSTTTLGEIDRRQLHVVWVHADDVAG